MVLGVGLGWVVLFVLFVCWVEFELVCVLVVFVLVFCLRLGCCLILLVVCLVVWLFGGFVLWCDGFVLVCYSSLL